MFNRNRRSEGLSEGVMECNQSPSNNSKMAYSATFELKERKSTRRTVSVSVFSEKSSKYH